MKILKTIFIAIIFLTLTKGWSQEYDVILWQVGKKLSWKDFKGIPQENSRAAAITGSGITYKFSSYYRRGKRQLDFKVSTFFYPNSSWYRPELCNDLILSHEQLHFDITEIYARKMRAELVATKFSKNVKADVRAIYKKINTELNKYQDLYDTATDYSRNQEQQLLWNKKIKTELRKN